MHKRSLTAGPAHGSRALKLALAVAVGAGVLVVATPVLAAPCGDDGTTLLYDSGGYYWDFAEGSSTGPDRNDPFATLYDSGSDGPAGTPPGPRSTSDSYDDWGALFIGGDAETNLYHSDDNDACATEEGGRERVYPVVTIGGLQVQRKIFVPPSGLPGARILNLITNPGTSPVTTSVQVGDTQSDDNSGDLGSDSDTAVRASSSGDSLLTTADLWAVTSDDATSNSDLALAHVFDGMGGADRIDFVTLTGTDSDPADNLAYRWDAVTIAPGETAAFMSFEVQQGVAGASAPTENANAASQAAAWQSASPSILYEGMTDAEIKGVRNWPKPPITLNANAKKKQRVGKLSARVTCVEKGCTLITSGQATAKVSTATSAPVLASKRRFKLRTAEHALVAGQKTKIRLRFKRQALKKLRGLLEDGASARLAVTLDATSTAGGVDGGKLRIKLKP
jgi:hypothetical protein